ncbi:MAG TPA: CFI-box-CTERM domain-containing protein, partial [Candidatus Acidoferrum sp.]|nr:CFI-box-CTERM domain-containing protein [Candidatus Acidoferrum sp.]
SGVGSATVTAFSLNGFSSAVALSASGGPSGVSLSFSQNQLIPPSGSSNPYGQAASSVLSISVASWVPAGFYPIALIGTSGASPQIVIVHSTQLTLQVLAPKDFTLAVAPSILSIQPGTSTTTTVTVTSFGGFAYPVSLTANGAPTGVSLSFSPNPMNQTSGGAATSTLTVSVSSSASSGTYPMQIIGNSPAIGLSHSTVFTVTVSQSANPDFSITSSSPSIGINQGTSSSVNVFVSSINHFTSTVTLSAAWVGLSPQGVSFTIPSSATPPDDGSTPAGVTLSASSTAQGGSYTLSVIGASGSLSHTVNILVQVIISGGDFSVSISPSTITMIQGSQTTSSVTLQASGTFSSAVTLTTAAVNGLFVSFNPSTVVMPLAGSAVSQLTVSVAGSTPTGVYPIPILAASGPMSHSTLLTITVIVAAMPGMEDFAIAASPTTVMINQGSSGMSTISVYSQNAFSSTVSLSASWLSVAPTGVSVNLGGPVTPLSNAVASTTLTISASTTAPTGSYLLQVNGFSGLPGSLLVHTANVTVQVISPTATTITSTITPGSTTASQSQQPMCLIATATYGSQAAPEVQLLRNFRDNSIMKTRAGYGFMVVFNAWYYSFSPFVARSITSSHVEQAVMRVVLYPLVGILALSSGTFTLTKGDPEVAVVLSGLEASFLIGSFYLGLPVGFLRARVKRFTAERTQKFLMKSLVGSLMSGIAMLWLGEVLKAPVLLMISASTVVLSTLVLAGTITSSLIAGKIRTA